MGVLTQQQFRFFRQCGYLRLDTPVAREQVAAMKAVVLDYVERRIPPLRTNERGEVKRIDRLVDRDPVFREVVQLPQLLDPLESLLGPNIELIKNRHNHATVNRRDDIPFRLHRDILQWSRAIVTAIIYLEEATLENGCTHIVPGSHLLQFAGMPPDGGGGNWMDDHPEYADLIGQELPIPAPEGGIVLFDSLAFHSIGRNLTNGTRLSLTLAFASVDELAGVDLATRELVRGTRIYMGNDLHYRDQLEAIGQA